MRMIKVAFWYDYGLDYNGGLNYLRNLLYAISLIKDKQFEPYVFFGLKTERRIIEQFEPYAKVVLTPVLERKTIPWFVHKVLFKLFRSQVVVNMVMKKHGISVVSHSYYVYRRTKIFRLITWIPDFQYLHLPELFPGVDTVSKTRHLQELIRQSEIVVLSSYEALSDFKTIAPPECVCRGRVLQFVSQAPQKLYKDSHTITKNALERKFNFHGRFFFLPNQFWQHKNHRDVFEAVRILKEKGKNVLVLCTGDIRDGRLKDKSHIDSLLNYINANDLHDNIKILGVIDYKEVLLLMKFSVALLNPSRFEGWSSSVEEAKSIGKQVILSDINVHREQNPPGAHYFELDDAEGLSSILEDLWDMEPSLSNIELEREAQERLQVRMVEFGRAYVDIVNELAAKNA